MLQMLKYLNICTYGFCESDFVNENGKPVI